MPLKINYINGAQLEMFWNMDRIKESDFETGLVVQQPFAWSSQSHLYGTNLILSFGSSAEANLALQEQVTSVMYFGVNLLPVRFKGAILLPYYKC